MTVQELIVTLEKYPPNMLVVVDGYEGGYNHVAKVKQIQIRPATVICYSGIFEILEQEAKDTNGISAVLIPR